MGNSNSSSSTVRRRMSRVRSVSRTSQKSATSSQRSGSRSRSKSRSKSKSTSPVPTHRSMDRHHKNAMAMFSGHSSDMSPPVSMTRDPETSNPNSLAGMEESIKLQVKQIPVQSEKNHADNQPNQGNLPKTPREEQPSPTTSDKSPKSLKSKKSFFMPRMLTKKKSQPKNKVAIKQKSNSGERSSPRDDDQPGGTPLCTPPMTPSAPDDDFRNPGREHFPAAGGAAAGPAAKKPARRRSSILRGVTEGLTRRRRAEAPEEVFLTRFVREVRDKYHITQRELGRGTYGVVRRCRHRETGEELACKSILKSRVKNVGRLLAEIEVMASLDHPNVVELRDVYEDAKFLHLITPMYTGGDLFQRILRKGTFTEAEAAPIIRALLDVIAHCHGKGVAHRDLKPENVMFEGPEDGAAVRVIDFGLCKVEDLQLRAAMCSWVGTPYFVDPEVLTRSFTNKCDLWSVGVILHVLLAGYPPFMGDSDAEIFRAIMQDEPEYLPCDFDRVSPEARDLLARLLRKQGRRRPTAEAALCHPWFGAALAGEEGRSVARRLSGSSFLQQRFLGHVRRTRLERLAVTVVAEQLTEAEIHHLRLVFEEVDRDGDGTLDAQELGAFVAKMTETLGAEGAARLGLGGAGGEVDPQEVLSQLDTNGDMRVDLDEFIAAALDRSSYLREENVAAAFAQLDADGSGAISADNLAQHFGSLEHAREAIELYDLDGNGELDIEEFRQMLENLN